MRKAFSYLLYFAGFFCAFANLFELTVETDKGESIYRSPEYAAIVMVVSLFVYFVFRDAAIIVRGKKFTEE
jgi:hypothetical protein